MVGVVFKTHSHDASVRSLHPFAVTTLVLVFVFGIENALEVRDAVATEDAAWRPVSGEGRRREV